MAVLVIVYNELICSVIYCQHESSPLSSKRRRHNHSLPTLCCWPLNPARQRREGAQSNQTSPSERNCTRKTFWTLRIVGGNWSKGCCWRFVSFRILCTLCEVLTFLCAVSDADVVKLRAFKSGVVFCMAFKLSNPRRGALKQIDKLVFLINLLMLSVTPT